MVSSDKVIVELQQKVNETLSAIDSFSPECQRRLGYHPVGSEAQKSLFENNRKAFMRLYNYLEVTYGPSRELSLALTALQESLMWANAHVACNKVGA